MSLLDTASLIVTPNGYKEGKLYSVIPSDGSGDMSVVRATTATRVNSAGLVELVPYNYNTYSENFITSWGNDGTSTVTNNFTTAPNGMMTAAKLVSNVANGYGYKFNTVPNGTFTLSYYIKASANTTIAIAFNDIGGNGYIGSYGIAVTTEWQRISLTANLVGTSLLIDYSQLQLGVEYYIWGCQINEGAIKDYQKTETRLNIPRLDYSNGTCPSLLVEPQRTNICRDSNNLSGGAWLNQTTNSTLTRIQSGGPDGNAFDRLVVGGALNSDQGRFVQFTTNVGSVAVYSVYLKGSGNAFIGMYNGASATPTTIALTNEWTRYEVIATGGSGTYIDWALFVLGQSTCDIAFHQVEFATYATSYIPTTSASVTRNADVISKTGISSLIGQTEGTIFTDFVCDGFEDYGTPLSINDGTASNYIWLTTFANGNIRAEVYNGSVQASITYTGGVVGQRYKVAFAYKQNDFVMYVNGTQIGADASGNVPPSLSRIDYNLANNWSLALLNVNATALWTTRLTNTQLAALTTI